MGINRVKVLVIPSNMHRVHKLVCLLGDWNVQVATSVPPWKLMQCIPQVKANDLVVSDAFGRRGMFAFSCARTAGIPFVLRVRGDVLKEPFVRLLDGKSTRSVSVASRVQAGWELGVARFLLAQADLVIYNSEHIARRLRMARRGGRESVVYNPFTSVCGGDGSKADACSKRAKPGLQLLSVTNLNLWDKVRLTYEAMSSWVPGSLWEELDLRWTICGRGPLIGRFREMASRVPWGHRIDVLGWVDDVGRLYEQCDVFVHLTELDAFPNATMEAMSAGKAVITNSHSAGVREQVFDRENGRVIEERGQFLSAIRAYASSAALRSQHGQKGKRFVAERFSVDVQGRAFREALARVVAM